MLSIERGDDQIIGRGQPSRGRFEREKVRIENAKSKEFIELVIKLK